MAEPTTETMSAEEEIRSFFSHLEPAMDSGDTSGQLAGNSEAKQGEERKNKWPREQNKGQNVGKGNTYRSGRQSWDSWQSSGSHSDTQALQKELEYMKDNMSLMARSILRHDEPSQQRTDREFLFTVEQGSAGLHLFNSMMQSWKQRVETVHNSEPAKAGALFMGIMKEEPAGNLLWNYLKWDWDKAHLVADEREPLTHLQVMEHLSNILQSCEAPGAILKFHSTRPLAEQHRTPVTFLLSIGMREPKCLILYRAMMAMCGNGSSKVINMRVRRVRWKGSLCSKFWERGILPGRGRKRTKRRAEAQAPGTSDGAATNGYGAYNSAQHLLCQLGHSVIDMDGANLRSYAGLLLWALCSAF